MDIYSYYVFHIKKPFYSIFLAQFCLDVPLAPAIKLRSPLPYLGSSAFTSPRIMVLYGVGTADWWPYSMILPLM